MRTTLGFAQVPLKGEPEECVLSQVIANVGAFFLKVMGYAYTYHLRIPDFGLDRQQGTTLMRAAGLKNS
jgi:hypothetical protein